jgi:hypothetical protein
MDHQHVTGDKEEHTETVTGTVAIASGSVNSKSSLAACQRETCSPQDSPQLNSETTELEFRQIEFYMQGQSPISDSLHSRTPYDSVTSTPGSVIPHWWSRNKRPEYSTAPMWCSLPLVIEKTISLVPPTLRKTTVANSLKLVCLICFQYLEKHFQPLMKWHPLNGCLTYLTVVFGDARKHVSEGSHKLVHSTALGKVANR